MVFICVHLYFGDELVKLTFLMIFMLFFIGILGEYPLVCRVVTDPDGKIYLVDINGTRYLGSI